MARIGFGVALLACIAWAGLVGYQAWTGWPHMSLDLSHTDIGTQWAYESAVMWHVITAAAVGLTPLVIVGTIIARFNRPK